MCFLSLLMYVLWPRIVAMWVRNMSWVTPDIVVLFPIYCIMYYYSLSAMFYWCDYWADSDSFLFSWSLLLLFSPEYVYFITILFVVIFFCGNTYRYIRMLVKLSNIWEQFIYMCLFIINVCVLKSCSMYCIQAVS